MTQGQEKFEKITQDAAEMGRENVEAVIKAGTIFFKGYEDLMRTAVEMTQKSAEKQSKYMQQALSMKNLNELTSLQNKMVQDNFDDFMQGTTKLSEMTAKLLSEASEPVNAQVNKSVEKASKAMAA